MHRALYLGSALFLLALAACSQPGLQGFLYDLPDGPIEFETVAQADEHETLARGHWGSHDFDSRTDVLIRSGSELRGFWDAYFPESSRPALPGIDFSEQMVVAVLLGERPSGGYAIEVQNVEHAQGVLNILAEERVPGDGCPVTGALTYPFHIIAIPRTGADINLVDAQHTVHCAD